MGADQKCDGKVALVRKQPGLGKAIAARLAAEGATVALTARTSDPDPKYQGSLSQTRDEIVAAGGRAVAVQADLSQPEGRESVSGPWQLDGADARRRGHPRLVVVGSAVQLAVRRAHH